ncbi:MAG: efflux RND transporter periplasmic adaptor subunit [Clostridia bacterium]|nr:efflux RND transporter periplasmic adaptor subunit [Clostridia bacterium]
MRAPSDGYVSAILCAEGSYLAAGIPAVILTDTENMTLTAEADEIYLSRLSKGQKVSVIFDAFPEKAVEAEIDEVFPYATVSGGAAVLLWETGSTTVEVRIRMLDDVEELIPGLSATATVETCRVKDALLIPSVSLLSDEKGDYVYVFSKGYAVKKYVKRGSVAGEMTQIVDGLECGEEVVASPDDALSPGMRVRHVE